MYLKYKFVWNVWCDDPDISEKFHLNIKMINFLLCQNF